MVSGPTSRAVGRLVKKKKKKKKIAVLPIISIPDSDGPF